MCSTSERGLQDHIAIWLHPALDLCRWIPPAPIRKALRRCRNPSMATCKAVSPRGLACCLWQLEIPPHCCSKARVQIAPLKSIWKNYLLNIMSQQCAATVQDCWLLRGKKQNKPSESLQSLWIYSMHDLVFQYQGDEYSMGNSCRLLTQQVCHTLKRGIWKY